MIGIYQIKNKINENSYIGQSKYLNKRIARHFQDAYNPNSKTYDYPLMRAIRKYGQENFEVIILSRCSISELDEQEIFWIEETNSVLNGYNQKFGGSTAGNFVSLTPETLSEITRTLSETDLLHKVIAKQFGVSTELTQGINTGRYWKRDLKYPLQEKKLPKIYRCTICNDIVSKQNNNCVSCAANLSRVVKDRPGPMELAKSINDIGYEATGRMYQVSGNAVKKWCVSYGIGKLKKDVVKWYLDNK